MVLTITNSGPPSFSALHPIPTFCVRPNRSPLGASRSIRRVRGRRPVGPSDATRSAVTASAVPRTASRGGREGDIYTIIRCLPVSARAGHAGKCGRWSTNGLGSTQARVDRRRRSIDAELIASSRCPNAPRLIAATKRWQSALAVLVQYTLAAGASRERHQQADTDRACRRRGDGNGGDGPHPGAARGRAIAGA